MLQWVEKSNFSQKVEKWNLFRKVENKNFLIFWLFAKSLLVFVIIVFARIASLAFPTCPPVAMQSAQTEALLLDSFASTLCKLLNCRKGADMEQASSLRPCQGELYWTTHTASTLGLSDASPKERKDSNSWNVNPRNNAHFGQGDNYDQFHTALIPSIRPAIQYRW